MAPTDGHRCLRNAYGDQPICESTVRWWVVRFSSGKRDSEATPLVKRFTGAACRLLFIAGKNTELMVVAVLKSSIL